MLFALLVYVISTTEQTCIQYLKIWYYETLANQNFLHGQIA